MIIANHARTHAHARTHTHTNIHTNIHTQTYTDVCARGKIYQLSFDFQVEEENILYPGGDSEADSPLLYVLHNAIAITGQNIEEKPNPDVLRLREKVEQLKQLAGRCVMFSIFRL